jgi:hypothetical protein
MEGPQTLYQSYYLRIHKTLLLAGQLFEGIKLKETLQDIIRGCEICQCNNPATLPCLSLGPRDKAHILGKTGNLTLAICQEAQTLNYFWSW